MEDIPNKIVNYLGIVADVNLLHSNEDKEFIEIVVERSNVPTVSYTHLGRSLCTIGSLSRQGSSTHT